MRRAGENADIMISATRNRIERPSIETRHRQCAGRIDGELIEACHALESIDTARIIIDGDEPTSSPPREPLQSEIMTLTVGRGLAESIQINSAREWPATCRYLMSIWAKSAGHVALYRQGWSSCVKRNRRVARVHDDDKPCGAISSARKPIRLILRAPLCRRSHAPEIRRCCMGFCRSERRH